VPDKLFFASSNAAKLREFQGIGREHSAGGACVEALRGFAELPAFPEKAPGFAENALGKALHYSRICPGMVFADDSGLVVPALAGAPGVRSARYAGPHATNEQRIEKLLKALSGKEGASRSAHFVCAIALASRGRAVAIVTARADGVILERPRGSGGFGYDPVFLFPPIGKTFAELGEEEKNRYSHRGQAFRKLLNFLNGEAPSD